MILDQVLLRAPLLPVRALSRSAGDALATPLAQAALELAAPDLPAGRARAHYAARAAFRATPRGLWAGTCMGELGPRTRIHTADARALIGLSWGALARLGRALLDDPELREQARLRAAPSRFADADEVRWLALGEGATARWAAATLDDTLARVLDEAADWRPFAQVRAAVGDEHGAVEYLLALVDDGLLAHDLAPPLVGPRPLEWMQARLAACGAAAADVRAPLDEACALLAHASAQPSRETVRRARAGAARLLEDANAAAMTADLVHEPRATAISRVAVERAAAVADVLYRVQDALTPPAAERALAGHALADALDAATETFGAGAFDLGALALGHYGTSIDPSGDGDSGDGDGHGHGSGSGLGLGLGGRNANALVSLLVERMLAAAGGEVDLTSAELGAVAPPTPLPPTFELVLAPAREPRGAPPGTGWLLGLHAPAGATWGRFAHALGEPMAAALAELAEAERREFPDEERLDVSYAPSAELGELTAHPPVRARALALSSWPAGPALTPAEVEVFADPAAPDPLALRASGQPVVPSPLWRVRSTTAPEGAYRLLAGFSLARQHAPWALQLGPLGGLPRLPRIRVDGFVVAPASFSVPPLASPAALRRWRREARVPRFVQVGHEDELLWVDLDARGAHEELARLSRTGARAYEVWPPLDDLADAGGRRVEIVAAVVRPRAPGESARTDAIATAPRVPPPLPAPGWTSFKLFGADERAERVLARVRAVVTEARGAGEIDSWFFLPYVDGPGRRDHLRVRVRGGALDRFAARLQAALAPARAAHDVVAIERGDYFREPRFSDEAEAVERIFASDSELVCDLLDEPDGEPLEATVLGMDALAAGAGLDLGARHALAARRRAAYGVPRTTPLAEAFRARQARLHERLAEPPAPFVAHRKRVAAAVAGIGRERMEALLPALLHLHAVRLNGPERAVEIGATYFWERALEGVIARGRRRK